MPRRVHVIVSGRVGDMFLNSMRDKATYLGLAGWALSMDDGRIEAVAEGGEGELRELVGWCHIGPVGSDVADVEVEWSDAADGYAEFKIEPYRPENVKPFRK